MAKNFKMKRKNNGEGLHIKLRGDFDGTSAHELVNELNKALRGNNRVIVHTEELRNVLPFGCSLFGSTFGLTKSKVDLLCFTGGFANQIAPEGIRVSDKV